MKQVFIHKGAPIVEDVAEPTMSDYDIKVAVSYSFISSGTEGATLDAAKQSLGKRFLSDVKKYTEKIKESVHENGIGGTISLIKGKQSQYLELGYSCSGRVIACGKKVERFRVGDYVACAGAGRASHAQVITVSENLSVPLADATWLKEASMIALGGTAMQGLRRAPLQFGETVCVVGLGILGQLTVQLARHAGYRVIGIDLDPYRLELACTHGCDVVVNPREDDANKRILFETDQYGVDATLITAGASTGSLIDQAMEYTRRKGTVVLVGSVPLDFSRDTFYAKEIDFLISTSYGPGRYDARYEEHNVDYPYAYVRWTENRNMRLFVELIERGEVNVSHIVSHEFSVDEVAKAFGELNTSHVIGMALRYDEASSTPVKQMPLTSHDGESVPFVPTLDIRFACIGVGGFAKVKLLPVFSRAKESSISWVVDTQIAQAMTVSRQYGAAHCGRDYHDVVNSDEANVCVVATPHGYHTDQTLALLRSGKAVFVEKPAAIDHAQLERWRTYLAEENADPYVCVDFNRSRAPLVEKIQKITSARMSPLFITYRMNAGYIPKAHWIQSKEHGGRIIGEACHIFELFLSLVDAYPTRVSVEAMTPRAEHIFPHDNVSVTLHFSDGSITTLLYTAIGNTTQDKERMELFFEGTSLVLDDYKELKSYGINELDTKLSQADKGHDALIATFIDVVKGVKDRRQLHLRRALDATYISIVVDELARAGGGVYTFDTKWFE